MNNEIAPASNSFDIAKLLRIQSELNDFTLRERKVFLPPNASDMVGPVGAYTPATMELAQRDGEFIRHQCPLIQLIDMYQWAGNREQLELHEAFWKIVNNNHYTSVVETATREIDYQNLRVECVDVMHFDLSVLILTKATVSEIDVAIIKAVNGAERITTNVLEQARAAFDNLQLRKWWTTKTITIEEIRNAALLQFGALIAAALRLSPDAFHRMPFASLDDIEQTYLKKVEVNYNRIKNQYNHITDKEMGNASV